MQGGDQAGELLSGQPPLPSAHRVLRSLARGAGAGHSPRRKAEQLGAPIVWVGGAVDVAHGYQLAHQLGGSLFGDSEVAGEARDRCVALADEHEGEPVGRTHVGEPAAAQTFLDPVHQLSRQPQCPGGGRPVPVVIHAHRLTDEH